MVGWRHRFLRSKFQLKMLKYDKMYGGSMSQNGETPKYLGSLDGLKGIGALLIACVWHYQHLGPKEGSPFFVIFRPFYEQGDLLVELFFW